MHILMESSQQSYTVRKILIPFYPQHTGEETCPRDYAVNNGGSSGSSPNTVCVACPSLAPSSPPNYVDSVLASLLARLGAP